MRGLTLIETLIYLALFSFLVTGALASLISVRSGMERIEAGARLTDEGHFVLERLRYEIERADSVVIGNKSSITVESDGDQVSFYPAQGALMREVSGTAAALTEPVSTLSNLSFTRNPDESFLISFSLTVATRGGNPLSAVFSESVFNLAPS